MQLPYLPDADAAMHPKLQLILATRCHGWRPHNMQRPMPAPYYIDRLKHRPDKELRLLHLHMVRSSYRSATWPANSYCHSAATPFSLQAMPR